MLSSSKIFYLTMLWKFLFLKETFQSFINFRLHRIQISSGYVSSSWNQVWIIVTLLVSRQGSSVQYAELFTTGFLSVQFLIWGAKLPHFSAEFQKNMSSGCFSPAPVCSFGLCTELYQHSAPSGFRRHTNMQARFWKFGLLLFMQNMHVLLYCAQSHK